MNPKLNYAIGITTFKERFEPYLIPLVQSIKKQRPDQVIWIAVNGENGETFCENYRKNILRFCANFDYVYLFMHAEFRSLAKLWNNIVISNSKDYTLMLNDDVIIKDHFFDRLDKIHYNREHKMGSRSFVIREDCIDEDQPVADSDFSHFMINIEELMKVNWFEERLLCIGHEDLSFTTEYKIIFSKYVDRVQIKGIYNESPLTNRLKNIKVNPENNKYAQFNEDFFDIKYKKTNYKLIDNIEHFYLTCQIDNSQQYPYESFYRGNRHKI